MYCNKLKVDLTQENVISVALWVQAVAHLLLPWLRVTPPSQSGILAKHELENSFCNCIFCQKGGGTLPIFR